MLLGLPEDKGQGHGWERGHLCLPRGFKGREHFIAECRQAQMTARKFRQLHKSVIYEVGADDPVGRECMLVSTSQKRRMSQGFCSCC